MGRTVTILRHNDVASPFAIKAEGGAIGLDREMVRKALEVLIDPMQTFELRGIPSGRSKVCRGDHLDRAVDAAWKLSDDKGVYYTLNPCRMDLNKPAANGNIVGRKWLLIDVDPVRQADVSATDAEKDAAAEIGAYILDYLTTTGWPAPVIVDSGNGWHLLYRIDLPNEKLSQQLVKSVLIALGDRFDDPRAKVDRSVHNAARIAKLPGTWARKGRCDDPERPHRMARLIIVPGSIECVSVEQLTAIANPSPDPTSTPTQPTNGHASAFAAKATGGGLDGYVKRAIEGECGKLALSPQGDRNNYLNIAALCLGTMAGWPEMVGLDPRGALYRTAIRIGLGEHETLRTIESGWLTGVDRPRMRPEQPINGKPKHEPPRSGLPAKLTIGLDEVKPEKVDWFWENRIAPGFIAIFAGRTGFGKSFVLCDVAARLSRGDAPPYSSLPPRKIRTLIISEDPVNVMLGPRLIELGADRSMIRFLTWEAMAVFQLDDTAMLDRLYDECRNPELIIVDPPANFLGETDEHKNAEVRNVLRVMIAWLNTHRVACAFVMHVNKSVGKGLDAVERIVGSVAWGSSARMTIAFSRDPDIPTQFLCGGTKNNMGPIAEPLAYRIVKTDTLATIEWVGPTDANMEDAMNKVKRKPVGVEASEWVTDRFREQREWASNDLRQLAVQAGVSTDAIFKGAEVRALPIIKRPRVNADGKEVWTWKAKDGWPEPKTESPESPESRDAIPFKVKKNKLSDKETHSRNNGLSGLSELSNGGHGTERASESRKTKEELDRAFGWDTDLDSPEQRIERRRFKIGTWLRNLLWGSPAPGAYVLKIAGDSGFEEGEIREVASLIGIDMGGDNWIYRGF